MNGIEIFKALSDPTRLKILELVKNEEKCICEIVPETQKTQPTISQHLRILRNANLVKQRKEGTNIWITASNDQIYPIIEKIKELSK
jgi:ArsR family transcriptional regulator, arsenate/arsenite/antimonite-responsive transcriptional repressor